MPRLLLAVVLMLAACETPEQTRVRYASICDGYGFRLGTDAHANCVMLQEQRAWDAAKASVADFQRNTEFWANRNRVRTCMPMGYGYTCY